MASSDPQLVPQNPATERPPIRVLVVDDVPDVARIMSRVVDSDPQMRCVGCLDSAEHLLAEVRSLGAQVVLLDATMPGRDPLDALRELAAALPAVKTVVYSGYDDSTLINSAMVAGAWGCVSKGDAPDAALRAIRDAAAGKIWSPGLKRRG